MNVKHLTFVSCFVLLLPFWGETSRSSGGRGSGVKPRPPNNPRTSNTGGNPTGGKFGGGTSSNSGYRPVNKPTSTWSGLSSNKQAVVGAALGAGIGFWAGNRLAHSFHHGGHTYWYGDRYYRPSPGKIRCVFYVDKPDWNVLDENKTVIRELIFECPSYQHCCEMSCCGGSARPRSTWSWWKSLLTVLAVIAIFCCCASLLITQIRKRRQLQQSSGYVATSTSQHDQKNYAGEYTDNTNQSGFYPQQQPYPTAAPPQSYPPYGGGAYPPAPAAGYSYPQQYPPPSYPGYQPVRNY